jgi:hypothetical protein
MNPWSLVIVLIGGCVLAGRFAYLDQGDWPSLDHCVGMFVYAGGMCAMLRSVQNWGL